MLMKITHLQEVGIQLHEKTAVINPDYVVTAQGYQFQFAPDLELYELYVGPCTYIVTPKELDRILKEAEAPEKPKKTVAKKEETTENA